MEKLKGSHEFNAKTKDSCSFKKNCKNALVKLDHLEKSLDYLFNYINKNF